MYNILNIQPQERNFQWALFQFKDLRISYKNINNQKTRLYKSHDPHIDTHTNHPYMIPWIVLSAHATTRYEVMVRTVLHWQIHARFWNVNRNITGLHRLFKRILILQQVCCQEFYSIRRPENIKSITLNDLIVYYMHRHFISSLYLEHIETKSCTFIQLTV